MNSDQSSAAGDARPVQIPPPPANAGRPAAEASSVEFQRLDLVSGAEATSADRPATARVLRHRSARGCGRLIEQLYDPLGRGGSPDSYYLVYQDGATRRAAATWIDRLDQPAPTEGSDSFDASVGQLVEWLERVAPPSAEQARGVEDALTRVADAERGRVGWAAAMLAGATAAEMRFDLAAARTCFSQAARLADPGSIEQMMAQWRIARTFEEQGEKRETREACQEIAQRFAAHGDSHVLQRARLLAAQ